MRGDERLQGGMFSYVMLEQRVPQDHPLREIRRLTDAVLRSLSAAFDAMYASSGRPSIAPEYVLRALLLQPKSSAMSHHEPYFNKLLKLKVTGAALYRLSSSLTWV